MSFEPVNTDWWDPNALRLPPYKVGRVNFGAGRSYIRINPDGLESPLRLYTSLTTAISTCSPMENTLLEWHCRLGLDEARRYTRMKAEYGTLMHLQIGKFLIEKAYDFDRCQEAVEEYTSTNSFWEKECKYWHEDLKKDMAAFIQFYFDYKIIPLGIEYVLLSERGFGTLIDLVCKMTYKRKEVTAIINFKSGRHTFYRSNGIQVECEKQLWEENFPDLPLEAAFNWSPKDWRTNPGYNFKDWSGEVSTEEVDAILKLAEIRYASRAEGKQYLTIQGFVSTQGSLEEALHRESIEEYCNRKYGNTPQPEIKSNYKGNELPI